MYVHINIYIYIYKSKYDCFGSRESDVLLPDCSSRIRDSYVQNELTRLYKLAQPWSALSLSWYIMYFPTPPPPPLKLIGV